MFYLYNIRTDGNVNSLPFIGCFRYGSCLIRCPLKETASPDYVSVFFKTATDIQQEMQIKRASNLLPVRKVKVNEERSLRNYTVCVIPLYNNYSDVNELVEFIEISKIFGAEHFIFYNFSISPLLDQYLNFYLKEGTISLHKWTVPNNFSGMDYLHYFGLLSTVNDCLYQTIYHTRYTVFVDVDEFIVPMVGTTWDSILSNQSFSLQSPYAALLFRCAFFKKEWKDDETFTNNSIAMKYNIKSLLKTKREPKIWRPKQRSKLLVRPERVFTMGIHHVHAFISTNYVNKNVPPETGLMFHYRNWDDPDKPYLTERRLHAFSEVLLDRISGVHRQVTGVG